jgi:hypothetical protein
MKLKRMFESLKNCKEDRKNYVIDWNVTFNVDDHYYLFAFLPTILWEPWPFRYPNSPIISIMWLNCTIAIGTWKNKENTDNV